MKKLYLHIFWFVLFQINKRFHTKGINIFMEELKCKQFSISDAVGYRIWKHRVHEIDKQSPTSSLELQSDIPSSCDSLIYDRYALATSSLKIRVVAK
jgi:hypothetical protein